MQQLYSPGRFCEARAILPDNELHRLTRKYHHRHPTFTIDIQERTCQTILLACIYYYRQIEIDLRCQCIYNQSLYRFQSNWSTDYIEYQDILEEIFSRLHSLLINRSLEDQIESIIEEITKYFTRLNPIDNKHRQIPTMIPRQNSISTIAIIQYERSPQSQRRQFS